MSGSSVSRLTRGLLALLAAVLIAGLATEAIAARRALVIGIDQYEVPAYRTSGRTARDAEQVAAVLRQDAEYETVVVVPPDADRATFLDRLAELRSQIAAGDFVLVFFSGHGIEKFDDNWLLLSTVPANFDDRSDVMREQLARNSISLNQLLRDLKPSGAGSIVVVVNACRSDGLKTLGIETTGKAGMSHIRDIPQSTAILYASSSGRDALVCSSTEDCANTTGGLTVFTRRFVEQLKTPNQPLESLYRSVGTAVEQDLAASGFDQTAALYIDGFKFTERAKVVLGVLNASMATAAVELPESGPVEPSGAPAKPVLAFERPNYLALNTPAYAILAATVSENNARRQLDLAKAAGPSAYQGLQPQLHTEDWGNGTTINYVTVPTRGLRMAEDICIAVRTAGGDCESRLAADLAQQARLARSPVHGGAPPSYDVEKALRWCNYVPLSSQSEYAYVMYGGSGSDADAISQCANEVADIGSPNVGKLAIVGAQYLDGFGEPTQMVAAKAGLDALADDGYADAILLTAEREFFGGNRYGPPDDKRAQLLAAKAASAGLFRAMNMLANSLWVTPKERIDWLRRSADAGSAVAMAGLGYALWSGSFDGFVEDPRKHSSLAVDRPEAVKWLREAYALTGDQSLLPFLVVAYDHGTGVPRDSRLAAELLLEYFGSYGYSVHDEFDPGESQAVTLLGEEFMYSDDLRAQLKRRLAGLGLYTEDIASAQWDVADALHGLVDNWCRLSLCGAP